MSDTVTTEEGLLKLKVSELKKICKKHDLMTSGTKLELVSRLIENKGESFTILQPGDEDKLLGDDADGDSTSFNLTDASALDALDKPDDELIALTKPTVDMSTSLTSSLSPIRQPIPGSKRCAAVLEVSETEHNATNESLEHTAAKPQEIHIDASSCPSETDRLLSRANRFGLSRAGGSGTLSDEKLTARAKRFGLPVSDSAGSTLRQNTADKSNSSNPTEHSTSIDAEKLRKRAERFGAVTSSLMEKVSDDERKASRLNRFGGSGFTQSGGGSGFVKDDEAMKAARAIKFGIQTDEEKLLKRKARFGLV